MKINNYLSNNLNISQENFLKKGLIFKGKIIDIFESQVLIEVNEQGTIRGTISSDIDMNLGQEISFLVKSIKGSEIKIKPLIDDATKISIPLEKSGENSSISKLLENMNIKDSELSIELIENLMKQNIPLNKENISNSINILNKSIELGSLLENEQVILAWEDALSDIIKDTNNLENKTLINSSSLNEQKYVKISIPSEEQPILIKEEILDKILSLKSDITKLIITDRKEDSNIKDLSMSIKDAISEDGGINIKENLPKLISFFVKNNIEANLNNIINMKKLDQDPTKYFKNLRYIENIVKENIGKNKLEKILSPLKGIDTYNKSDTFKVKEIQKIIEEIKSYGIDDIDDELVELKNRFSFLEELNKNISFNFIPINYKKQNLDGMINFFKKKNKNIKNDNTNVLINVDTKKLGNIRVHCNLKSNNINIKISIKKDDLNLFKLNEQILIDKVSDIGYNLGNIDYILNEDIKIIDAIEQNPAATYFLDIRV